MYLDISDKVQDYKIKQRRLCIPFSITGHATPASKVHASDLNGVLYLRSEGKTAEADAVDADGNFTTPVDASGLFGILLNVGDSVRKVMRASVEQRSGSTATNKDQAVALQGDSSSGITENGNIAIDVTCSGLDLSAENFDGVLIIEYMIE